MKFNRILLLVLLNTAIGVNADSAVFAGGCFWCMEKDFIHLEGVSKVTVGYSGGDEKNPTYRQVSKGLTGHTEVILLEFDPALISYPRLLEHFWINIDPTQQDQQFCDRGKQYRSAIFYQNERQHQQALASLAEIQQQHPRWDIFTEISAAKEFFPAEEYHQNYFQKNPLRYKYYRYSCGRDKRLEELWGKEEKK